jgi:AcrR family transcriptional regulator
MSRAKESSDSAAVRERILGAAFEAFQERGYAATSTLEIATRARVSKRELYALVGNKQKMLIAAIGERARRLQAPADMPMLRDRATLAHVLTAFGTQFVREVSDPDVVAVFRLAIAEAVQAPEVARTLDSLSDRTFARSRHGPAMLRRRFSVYIRYPERHTLSEAGGRARQSAPVLGNREE